MVELADTLGSEGSAAGGGRSDLSEWPGSIADAAALSARKISGHPNRTILQQTK